MAVNTAIQTLSAIATPLRPDPASPPAIEGSAPLWDWFRPGHVLELSAHDTAPSAQASVAVELLVRAQAESEPVAWIEVTPGLYPPDLASAGVDLESLVVVQPPPPKSREAQGKSRGGKRSPAPRSQAMEAVRAAEVLLRSGAFGLVVLDLSQQVPKGALTWLARLHGLLRLHAARLLVLTGVEAASLGPLVSLRVAPHYRRLSAERWVIEHEVLKSKLGCSVRARDGVRTAPVGASGVGVGPRLSKSLLGVNDGQGQATERCA